MLFFIFSLSFLPLCFLFFIKIPLFTTPSGFIYYFLILSFYQRVFLFLLLFIFIFIPTVWFFYKNSSFCITPFFNIDLPSFKLKSERFLVDGTTNFWKINTLFCMLPFRVLRWKPLFKKTSYFGLYKANRNKWLNN